jgi:predicted NACHT family NTPase
MATKKSVGSSSISAATNALVNDIYLLLKNSGKKEFAKWRIEGGARSLKSKLKRYQLVRTILNVDKPVDLTEFYFPTRVKEYGIVRCIQDMKPERPISVRGHVGQGKSIFLRYLAIQELKENVGNIPLFLELRNLQSQSLKSFIFKELSSLNLEMDEELFEIFWAEGQVYFPV